MAFTSAYFARAAPRPVLPTGGIPRNTLVLPFSCRLTDGSSTPETSSLTSALKRLEETPNSENATRSACAL